MEVYIILIFLILCSMFIQHKSGEAAQKRKEKWLFVIFLYIYLLCALRSVSVGRDIQGYADIYNMTKSVAFRNFDYTYFESGYILLMKIFSRLGVPFQGFLAASYAIIIVPVYVFIKKYSKNYAISSLVFVCFQYLNFDLSGVRQAISMSIALLAYIALVESKKFRIIKYILIVAVACFFHKSAFICYIFVLLYFVKSIYLFYSLVTVCLASLFFIRVPIMTFIREWFEKDTIDADAGLYIGTTFVFTLILAVYFIWYNNIVSHRQLTVNDEEYNYHLWKQREVCNINTRMYIISIAAIILFGSDNAVRSYTLLNQVMINQMPNATEDMFEGEIFYVVEAIICIVLLSLFTVNVLINGGFDIVPYRFFWQTA